MKHLSAFRLLASAALLAAASGAGATVMLVQTSDPGYYNNSIGTRLNLSGLTGISLSGSDNCAEPFPLTNDCSTSYADGRTRRSPRASASRK